MKEEEEDPVKETTQSPSANMLEEEEGHTEVETNSSEAILKQEPVKNHEISSTRTGQLPSSTKELFYQFGGRLTMNVEQVRRKNKMTIGAVVRDVNGNLVAALAKNHVGRVKKDLEKPLALKDALEWWAGKDRPDDEQLKVVLTSNRTAVLLRGFDLELWTLPTGYKKIVEECRGLVQNPEFAYIEEHVNQVARIQANQEEEEARIQEHANQEEEEARIQENACQEEEALIQENANQDEEAHIQENPNQEEDDRIQENPNQEEEARIQENPDQEVEEARIQENANQDEEARIQENPNQEEDDLIQENPNQEEEARIQENANQKKVARKQENVYQEVARILAERALGEEGIEEWNASDAPEWLLDAVELPQ